MEHTSVEGRIHIAPGISEHIGNDETWGLVVCSALTVVSLFRFGLEPSIFLLFGYNLVVLPSTSSS